MTQDLILKNIEYALEVKKPEYNLMLQNIKTHLPTVEQDTSNFYKSHSQFMQVTLDITALTPIKSIKQTLAEIEKTKGALRDAYINTRKKQVELKRKQDELENPKKPLDQFDKELLEIEILEIQGGLESSQGYVNGAIRKLNFLINQHQNLLKMLGKEQITEEDYEREEARYHIMTCMKQALIAARSRGGLIDEGNYIYLFDLGISSAQAQLEVSTYLEIEQHLLKEGKSPPHEMTVRWLEACADKFAKDPEAFAKRRGFSVFDRSSLTNSPLLEQATDPDQKAA